MRRTALIVSAGCFTLGVHLATCQTNTLSREAACHTLVPASVGGPAPHDASTMVIRYLGTSNYEIDYRGKVLLLDAFYDGQRGPHTRPIGIKADDIQHADAIYIGHPHIDHIADAPAISKRLNIPVVTSPASRPVLDREQEPDKLVHYVSGGETLKMDGYTVMTALAEHSALDPKVVAKYNEAAMAVDPLTPEDIAYFKRALSYNPPATDPTLDIPKHGTIAYVFVFDNGFKVAFRDSPGAVTQGERDLMQKVGGSVDVAMLGYNGFGINSVVDVTMKLAETYKPKLLLPAHQDAYIGGVADASTAPLFLALRDKLPGTRGLEPLYRTPVCINTKNGDVYYDALAGSAK